MPNDIDIIENRLLEKHKEVFKTLLADHSTRKNIFWATDSYDALGEGYQFRDTITIPKITGEHGNVIRPRTIKSKDEQSQRVRNMAEVFTPSWVCKEMIDYVASPAKAPFLLDGLGKASWQQSVLATCLEITCGEAPFLVSRYDTVTGEPIPIDKRIGILDRKLRVVGDNATDDEYNHWALLALGSVYGYEWQGDSLLLAREAVLATFVDYYRQRFGREPDEALLLQAAEIISWNLWQMDGLKAVVPCTCHDETKTVSDLFGGSATTVTPCPGCAKDDISLHNGIRCRLRRWLPYDSVLSNSRVRPLWPSAEASNGNQFAEKNIADGHKARPLQSIVYTLNTKYPMKFDFVIGNPPYQDETLGYNKGFAPPVYDKFLDGAYKVSDKVELIHPARFLFDAGSTPKEWNRKMLNDSHLKIVKYESDSSKVFPNVQLTGGVVVTYHDAAKSFAPIEVFTPYDSLNSILHKVHESSSFESMGAIVITRTIYRLTDKLHEDYPSAIGQLSEGHAYDMSSNIFDRLPQVFTDAKPDDNFEYLKIYGRKEGKRAYMYIRRDYVNVKRVVNVDKYKVVLAKADGAAGTIGKPIPARILGVPSIEGPGTGTTESFISIGAFDTVEEANNALKYVKTQFLRTLVSVLKVTQEINPGKFKYVPLQDFTSSSDIDWGASIHDIDRQLYGKYGLSQDETDFIERMVKPM